MWYHLSNNFTEIKNPITELRRPSFDYLDVDVTQLVLCVAPTVWQCLLSLSGRDDETRYIYEVYVKNPTPAEEVNSNIADASVTSEHRITPDVLSMNGGSIETKLIGKLRIAKEETLFIKTVVRQKSVQPNADQEREVFWNVDGTGEWTLRERGRHVVQAWKSFVQE